MAPRDSASTMHTPRFALLAVAMLALSGCVPLPVQPLNDSGENRIPAADFVNVYLTPATAERSDVITGFLSTPTKFATGPIWKRAFIGAPDSAAVFEVTNLSFYQAMVAGGIVERYTYDATGVLHYKSHDYPIKSIGSRATGMMVFSATRQPAANPKGIENGRGYFQSVEWTEFQIGNTAGQTFAGLPE